MSSSNIRRILCKEESITLKLNVRYLLAMLTGEYNISFTTVCIRDKCINVCLPMPNIPTYKPIVKRRLQYSVVVLEEIKEFIYTGKWNNMNKIVKRSKRNDCEQYIINISEIRSEIFKPEMKE